MAGMAFDSYGSEFLHLPFVDRPHERLHQHRTFWQYVARQIPPPEENPNRPDVDIRDSLTEYLVEIEVPGVKSTSEVTVKWTSTSSLVVLGTVERPAWGNPKQGMKKQQPAAPVAVTQGKDTNGNSHASESYQQDESLVVGERRLGPFRRYINFPIEIQAEGVTAKLEAGLLTLRVPKAEHRVPKHDVSIEIMPSTSLATT
jgi:HSP20 family molecular chaperone IbpA